MWGFVCGEIMPAPRLNGERPSLLESPGLGRRKHRLSSLEFQDPCTSFTATAQFLPEWLCLLPVFAARLGLAESHLALAHPGAEPLLPAGGE